MDQTHNKVEHRTASNPLPQSRRQRGKTDDQNHVLWKAHWTSYEIDSLITVMGNLVREGLNKDHEIRWVIAAKELEKYGVQRTPDAVKMIWMRGLRERSGIDERTAKKGRTMTTGLQPNRKRKRKEVVKGEARERLEIEEGSEGILMSNQNVQTDGDREGDMETDPNLKGRRRRSV